MKILGAPGVALGNYSQFLWEIQQSQSLTADSDNGKSLQIAASCDNV